MSEWSPKILSACEATHLADTWITQGRSSPAILYRLGIIRRSPCDAVYVVVSALAASEPCTVPEAPASDCISASFTGVPNRFSLPLAAHWSVTSAITDDGVIG